MPRYRATRPVPAPLRVERPLLKKWGKTIARSEQKLPYKSQFIGFAFILYIKIPKFEKIIYQSLKKSQKYIYNYKKMWYTDYVW